MRPGINFTMQVPDSRPVQDVLRGLTPELRRAALEAALRKGATIISREVKTSAPVGTGSTLRRMRRRGGAVVESDYGRLRDNVRVVRPRQRVSAAQRVATISVTARNAFWGYFLEYGWMLTRGPRGGLRRKFIRHIPARPFFFPAAWRGAQMALFAIERELLPQIIRAAERLAAGRGVRFATRLRGGRG